ncbi:MAG: peptidoglycan-associated lipoprotein Pal, partial [Candidatus Latescibacteria bacterium]|nr:peptidoglycan-associated lipoprotein Pal [Candidatus Latescibacterota bacterium]
EQLAAEEAKRKADEDARRKAEAEAEALRKAELTLNAIHFDFDRYNLRSDAQQILAKHATVFQKYPEANVTIEGHCDERGTIEYNLALGERRAKSARDYLVRYNLAPKRFKIVSFGKERPVDLRQNEEAWAKNRRAEFVVQETVISGK